MCCDLREATALLINVDPLIWQPYPLANKRKEYCFMLQKQLTK